MTDHMTNRNKYVQPAPRPFNLLVRGGLLTRFKGQVVSLAPGLSAIATVTVLFSGSAAHANCATGEDGDLVTETCNARVGGEAYPHITRAYNQEAREVNFKLILNEVVVEREVQGLGVMVQEGPQSKGNLAIEVKGGQITTRNFNNNMAVFMGADHAESEINLTVTVSDGAEITTETKHSHGVLVSNKGKGDAHIVMEGDHTSITTQADDSDGAGNAHGLWAEVKDVMTGGGLGSATAEMRGGSIATGDMATNGGENSYAIHADIDSHYNNETATAKMSGGQIETYGRRGIGLYAHTNGNGDAITEMSDGEIVTNGHRGYGMYSQTWGSGNAIARMSGGKITTNITSDSEAEYRGDNAYGVWAYVDANKRLDAGNARAHAEVSGGEIVTKSDRAYAIVASSNGSGWVGASLTEGTVHTSGRVAHGVFAWSYNRGDKTAQVVVGGRSNSRTDPFIKTTGDRAYGASAFHEVYGAAAVHMFNGKVETTGEEAHGLNAVSENNRATVHVDGAAVVDVTGKDADGIHLKSGLGFDIRFTGDVWGGTGSGAAIRTNSRAGFNGEIDINHRHAIVYGRSGIAIQDGDGNTEIKSIGKITGDIRLGAGDDTLKLMARLDSDLGTYNKFKGNIYGGAGNDTVTIDTLTLDKRLYALDGGVGGNDKLTFVGPSDDEIKLEDIQVHLSNWQRVKVDKEMSIDSESEFHVFGEVGDTPTEITIAGDVTNNAGDVFLSVQNGETGDEIRIEGNYTGSDTGSDVFALDMGRDADGVNTDTVVITGNTSGEITLLIDGLDSADLEGAPLVMDVVSVGGEANGTFTLVGGNYVTPDGEQAVIAGAHLYTLSETGRGWALSALSETGETNYQPSAPIYDSYGQSLLALNGPKSLRNRGSSEDFRTLAWEGGTGDQDRGSPLWLQMGADRITLSEENSTTGAALESTVWEMEIGADIVLIEIGSGLLVGGLMGSYAMGSTDVSSAFGDGSIDTSGLGLGVAATWYDTRRFYVDGQMTLASYSSDLGSAGLGTLTEENSGTGFAVSLEAGQQLDLGSRLTVIPQAQLSVSSVAFSDFADDAHGEQVTFEDASSQRLRLGLEFGLQEQEARRLYGIVNLFYEFGPGSEVDVTGVALTTESEPWAAGVGLGGTYVWNDRLDLFGETSYTTGLGNVGDTSALSVNAGFKVTF